SKDRLERIANDRQLINDEMALVLGELAQSNVAQEKQRLLTSASQYAEQFYKEWARVQQAATQMDQVLGHVNQLLALDTSLLPSLQAAVARLAPVAGQATKQWAPARGPLLATARLDDELAAFELEPLDQALQALEAALVGDEHSVMAALIAA
ncbi:hypothetical protein, partial [Francisella tularensis]|uniref:hypothetical protein n=1 Tax=Francisella tularensis TaxID=263 RepID=UPI0019237CA6